MRAENVSRYLIWTQTRGVLAALIKYLQQSEGKARTMKINLKAQIARVIAAQGMSRTDALDQINGRVYDARQYIKRRAGRSNG